MKKKQKFKSGDFLWITDWHWDIITPQIIIFVEGDNNVGAFMTDYPKDTKGEYIWWFHEWEVRKATFEESEAYLKTIIKP